MSSQRNLVHDLFNSVAPAWSAMAYDPEETLHYYPLGRIRMAALLRELRRFELTGCLRMLDAGCGTGDIALTLLADGHAVVGLDVAPAMVEECRRRYRASFPDRSDAEERFRLEDVEKFRFSGTPLDLVYAFGLLEYLECDDVLFGNVHASLRPGGLFFVECRNRLFNAVSGNAYTLAEAEAGQLATLTRALGDLVPFSPLPDAAIPEIVRQVGDAWNRLPSARRAAASPPPPIQYPTGMVRRQLSPADLARSAHANGFRFRHVVYYHFHPLPARYEAAFPELYNALSVAFQPLGETTVGAALASAFMGVLEKIG